MTYPTPWTVGLQVHSEGADNGWGDPIDVWAPAVDRAVYGWAPAGTGEEHDAARNLTEIDLDLYGPAESLGDVKPRDRVIVNGELFEVEGAVENFNFGPFGFAPGVRVGLKRVEG